MGEKNPNPNQKNPNNIKRTENYKGKGGVRREMR